MVYAVGAMTGTPQMDTHLWFATGLLAWVGSLVFAAFGLFMGYLLPSENVMQVLGPRAWRCWPSSADCSCRSRRARRWTTSPGSRRCTDWRTWRAAPLTGDGVHVVWVLNLVVWLAVFVVGAMWRFRRDTARV